MDKRSMMLARLSGQIASTLEWEEAVPVICGF
jgi:hypothetical protein